MARLVCLCYCTSHACRSFIDSACWSVCNTNADSHTGQTPQQMPCSHSSQCDLQWSSIDCCHVYLRGHWTVASISATCQQIQMTSTVWWFHVLGLAGTNSQTNARTYIRKLEIVWFRQVAPWHASRASHTLLLCKGQLHRPMQQTGVSFLRCCTPIRVLNILAYRVGGFLELVSMYTLSSCIDQRLWLSIGFRDFPCPYYEIWLHKVPHSWRCRYCFNIMSSCNAIIK